LGAIREKALRTESRWGSLKAREGFMRFLSAFTSIGFAILLAIVSIALLFEMRRSADLYGADVGSRFLEMPGGSYARGAAARPADPRRGAQQRAAQPATYEEQEAAALRRWIAANAAAARNYADPVLLRYDVAFLFAFGFFLMIVSVQFARAHVIARFGWRPRMAWLFALPAAIYIAADLAEDLMLWTLLTSPASISAALVGVVKKLTWLKAAGVVAAMAVAALLALWSMLRPDAPAPSRR